MTSPHPEEGRSPDKAPDTAAPGLQQELRIMNQAASLIAELPDGAARARVLSWLGGAFGVKGTLPAGAGFPTSKGLPPSGDGPKEIPGIARLSESGEFHLTVRDLKARSANDAAIRIVHVVCHAFHRLTGQSSVSSKNVLVPILKRFRAYDGNTRSALAKHRGITREGDNVSLDTFCSQEAEGYVAEVLNSDLAGSWRPAAQSPRRRPRPAEPEG